MQLKLKRSQRTAGVLSSKVMFMLDARAELTNEEKALVHKFGLAGLSIYDSEARKRRIEAGIDQTQSGNLKGSVRGLANLAMASLALRVTIGSLTGGHHIECKDMDELLGAENAIREGCQNMRAYLDVALTFDGREEVVQL